MLIRFKGAVIEIEGNHNFSLEVTESGMKFALEPLAEPKQETCPETIAPGAETVHRYVLSFFRKPAKPIDTIKVLRAFLSIGLGEAKTLGADCAGCIYIAGPRWESSEFARALNEYAFRCYSVQPAPQSYTDKFESYK